MNHDHISGYKEGEKAAWLGIGSNAVLFIIKIAAGIAGRSQAMIADALHTASDALTSIVVVIGFKVGQKPADEHHPFGHGKAESIAAKIVSIVLILLSVKVVSDSVKVLISDEINVPGAITLFVAGFSIIVKEITYRRVIRVGTRIESSSLMADAFHHKSDVFSSIAVLAGIFAARMGMRFMDPVAGIFVAVFIFKMGLDSFHLAYDELMDAAPPEKIRSRIEEVVCGCEGVAEVRKVMARKSGIEYFMEITIGVDKDKTVEEGHIITMRVRRDLFRDMPNVRDAIVHVEPASKK